jgi:hypothetical protein
MWNYCECGEWLPPAQAWTPFTKAQHTFRHIAWQHTVRPVRGWKPTLADARTFMAAAQVYIAALEDRLHLEEGTCDD